MKYITLPLVFVLSSFFSNGQLCEPEITVYFQSDHFDLILSETNRLSEMVQEMDSTKEYLVEIYAFTDSDNDDGYNLKLSEDRGEEVEAFIRDNFSGTLSQVDVFPKGESDPKFPNEIEGKKKLNRRVEVQLFETNGGKIIFRAKEGTELEVGRNYFGDCPICESEPKIQEVSSNAQAEAMGVSLVTNDGMNLQTGGMMTMTHSCENADPCASAIIRVPAADYDPDLTFWTTIDTLGGIRWVESKLQLQYENGFYVFRVPCFSGGRGYNADKKILQAKITTPFDVRGKLKAWDAGRVSIETTISNADTAASIPHKGGYRKIHSIRHEAKKDGISYSFDKAVTDQLRVKGKIDITIPKAAYVAEILLSDTTVKFKLPWNAKDATLYIPVIDSVYNLSSFKEGLHKYEYKKPEAEYYVKATSVDDNQVIRAYDIESLRIREKKRKKLIKVKLKRRAVKSANLK